MLQKRWTIGLLLAVGLAGCKSGGLGGLASHWPNPLAFLMPKKEAEPEKPSSGATPTPIQPGYSSAEDRSAGAYGSTSSTGRPTASSLTNRWPDPYGSRVSAGSQYGANMAYGTPSSGPSASSTAELPPYGASSYSGSVRSSGASSLSNPRSTISPQVGRYDPWPPEARSAPLTASRASAAGYTTSRDYSSHHSSRDRDGGGYSTNGSSVPNWRSWENRSTSSTGLESSDPNDRSSSWDGGAWSSSPKMERTDGSFSLEPSRGNSYRGSSTRNSSSGSSSYTNPYFGTSEPKQSEQSSSNPPSSGNLEEPSSEGENSPRSASGYSPPRSSDRWASNPSGRVGDTGYRPGETGYRPGDTGYRPGNTGYTPPNTPSYQMPGTSSTDSSGDSSSPKSGQYRPGSTRSYIPGQAL